MELLWTVTRYYSEYKITHLTYITHLLYLLLVIGSTNLIETRLSVNLPIIIPKTEQLIPNSKMEINRIHLISPIACKIISVNLSLFLACHCQK